MSKSLPEQASVVFPQCSWCTLHFVKFSFPLYVFEREKETERKRGIARWKWVGSCPKCSQWLRLSQAKARSQALSSSFPDEWQGSDYCSSHLLPPKVSISKKQKLGVEPKLKPRPSSMNCYVPSSVLTTMQTWAFFYWTNSLSRCSTVQFTRLRCTVLEHFHHTVFISTHSCSPTSVSSTPRQGQIYFLSIDLPSLDISYKWNK